MPSTITLISDCIKRIMAVECKNENLSQRIDDIAESLWIASSKSLDDAHKYLIDLCQKAEAGRYIKQ
jgi:hypothetical protein